MSAREPRFEVVRTDAGWFARMVAANGREVWRTSETYQRRRGADRAIGLIDARGEVVWLEVRQVDERTQDPA